MLRNIKAINIFIGIFFLLITRSTPLKEESEIKFHSPTLKTIWAKNHETASGVSLAGMEGGNKFDPYIKQAQDLQTKGDQASALEMYKKITQEAEKEQVWDQASISAGRVAEIYSLMGDYDQAISYGLKSLQLEEKVPHSPLIVQRFYSIGNIYYDKGDYPTALQWFEKGEDKTGDIAVDQNRLTVQALKAKTYREMGMKNKYQEIEQKALKLHQEEVKKWENEKNLFMVYIAGMKLVGFYQQLGEFEKALNVVDSLTDYCQKNGLTANIPMLYQFKASIYTVMFKYQEGMKYYKKTEEAYKQLGMEDSPSMLFLYLQMATNLHRYGSYEEEAGYIKKVEDKLKKYPDKATEMAFYVNTGRNFLDVGSYSLGAEYLHKALTLAKQENNITDQFFPLYFLAMIHFETGKIKDAVNFTQQSIQVAQKSGHPWLFQAYYMKARLLEEQGKPQEALEYYKNALDSVPQEDHDNRANLFLRLGERLLELNNRDEGFFYLKKALEEAQKIPIQKMLFYKFNKYFITARSYELLGEMDQAKKEYQLAEKFLEEVDSPPFRWRFYYYMGKIYEHEGDSHRAIACYEGAVKALEEQMEKIKTDAFKTSFPGIRSRLYEVSIADIYESLIRLLLEKGMKESAWNMIESYKARALLNILAGEDIGLKKEIPPHLAQEEARLRMEIQGFRTKIDLSQQNDLRTALSQEVKNATDKLLRARKDYEEVLNRIKLHGIGSEEYENLKVVKSSDLKDIYNLLDDNTVMVEYVLTVRESFAIIIKKGSISFVPLKISKREINRKIAYIRGLLTSPTGGTGDITKLHTASAELSQIIIAPVLEKTGEVKNLIIVPYGNLNFIPFYILQDNQGRELIENYTISYTPSSSALVFCRKKPRYPQESLSAFALGHLQTGAWSPLPGTTKEVNEIGKLFSSKHILTEDCMTFDGVKRQISKGSLIHFATHGLLDPAKPELSGLLLADRIMGIIDISRLDLKANLVVLSACETGLGQITGGDEIMGLSRAFMYAGTPSLIVSLWSVSDDSTSLMMTLFYTNLKRGDLNKAESMRLAQLKTREKYPHPFYWAPFVLIGDAK